ncbi:hypothetical protein DLAC_11232 [Tieghemostelium lacteum]|uniref:Uncharacterized protein n=1 Tax=Tieghemostelium lacteum TaxID=361077 RepID=A0A151Z3H3_TIELA|nr:hypothetical protein DLAC_11232 [Tieghemostelium lacteum]|eukprot:KYQ88512.1 hypothetical protein DLAC_11232 [Tieghemostelium lacteum]
MKVILIVLLLFLTFTGSTDVWDDIFCLDLPMFKNMNFQWGMITMEFLSKDIFNHQSCSKTTSIKILDATLPIFGWKHMVGYEGGTCKEGPHLFSAIFDPTITIEQISTPGNSNTATSSAAPGTTPLPSSTVAHNTQPTRMGVTTKEGVVVKDSQVVSKKRGHTDMKESDVQEHVRDHTANNRRPILESEKRPKYPDVITGEKLKFAVQSQTGAKEGDQEDSEVELHKHTEIQLLNALIVSHEGVKKIQNTSNPLFLYTYHFPCWYCTLTLLNLKRTTNKIIYYTYQWNRDYQHWQTQDRLLYRGWTLVPTTIDSSLANTDYTDPLGKETTFGYFNITFNQNIKDFLWNKGQLNTIGFENEANFNEHIDYFLSKVFLSAIKIYSTAKHDQYQELVKYQDWSDFLTTNKLDSNTTRIVLNALAYVNRMNCARSEYQRTTKYSDNKWIHKRSTPIVYIKPDLPKPKCKSGYDGWFCQTNLPNTNINVLHNKIEEPDYSSKICGITKYAETDKFGVQQGYYAKLNKAVFK